MGLVAAVQMARVALETDGRGRQRELHKRGLDTRAHHAHHPVDRRLAAELEAVEHAQACGEATALLQAQDDRRGPERRAAGTQAAVRVGGAQRGLDHSLQPPGAGERERDRAPGAVVDLQRQRGLAVQQAPVPAAQQALVQGLEHEHETLRGGRVGAVDLDGEAHIHARAPCPGADAEDERATRQRDTPEQPERGDAAGRRPGPDGAERARQGTTETRERKRHGSMRGSAQRRGQAAVEQPGDERKRHDEGRESQDSPEQKTKEHLMFLLRPRAPNGTAAIEKIPGGAGPTAPASGQAVSVSHSREPMSAYSSS